MDLLPLPVKKLRSDALLPIYQHNDDAGFDLASCAACLVPAHTCFRIPTGLAFAVPQGFEMQLRLRSSVAETTPLIMPNAPATIDAGYRGELFILVRNLSSSAWEIQRGERIAQAIIAPVCRAILEVAITLSESERGAGGFGSTGRF